MAECLARTGKPTRLLAVSHRHLAGTECPRLAGKPAVCQRSIIIFWHSQTVLGAAAIAPACRSISTLTLAIPTLAFDRDRRLW